MLQNMLAKCTRLPLRRTDGDRREAKHALEILSKRGVRGKPDV